MFAQIVGFHIPLYSTIYTLITDYQHILRFMQSLESQFGMRTTLTEAELSVEKSYLERTALDESESLEIQIDTQVVY